MSARVAVLCGAITMEGEIFQPCPRSRAAFAPVPSDAIPPRPFSPVKFSALMERVFALERRDKLLKPRPRPLKLWMLAMLLSFHMLIFLVTPCDFVVCIE